MQPNKGKNIVLFSDGTGNSSAKLFKTNVWRVYQALDLADGKVQIAHYDDGVGTSSFKPLAVLGGAFGWGLKRNVLSAYKFVCRNYKPGDRIYAFGFSRGAFTIRVLVGLIASQGLVDYNPDGTDAEAKLERDTRAAYRAYRYWFELSGWSSDNRERPVNDYVYWARQLRDKVINAWYNLRGYALFKAKKTRSAKLTGACVEGVVL